MIVIVWSQESMNWILKVGQGLPKCSIEIWWDRTRPEAVMPETRSSVAKNRFQLSQTSALRWFHSDHNGGKNLWIALLIPAWKLFLFTFLILSLSLFFSFPLLFFFFWRVSDCIFIWLDLLWCALATQDLPKPEEICSHFISSSTINPISSMEIILGKYISFFPEHFGNFRDFQFHYVSTSQLFCIHRTFHSLRWMTTIAAGSLEMLTTNWLSNRRN